MNYYKQRIPFFLFLFIFLGSSSIAQYKIKRSCFANGGESISGGDNLINGTIGQTAIGRINNSTWFIQSGFQEVVLYMTPIENSSLNLPLRFDISQNFPNPFNPQTTIRYALPRTAFVKIDIYNILGQHILSLVNKNKSAGFHIIRFNARSLASGLYVYTMQADDFFAVKKMLFTK